MGFSFRNLIRGKPEPEQSVENVSRIEIADNPIENIMTEIYESSYPERRGNGFD